MEACKTALDYTQGVFDHKYCNMMIASLIGRASDLGCINLGVYYKARVLRLRSLVECHCKETEPLVVT